MDSQGNRVAKIKLNGFIEAFRGMVAALEAGRDAAAPEYREAVDSWAKDTAQTAAGNLNRPGWLLSKQLTSVVRDYKNDGKIWALAGLVKGSSDKRDPGYYGKFHESGWRPNGGKPTAPPHFLRDAKRATTPALKAKVNEANGRIVTIINANLKKKRPET